MAESESRGQVHDPGLGQQPVPVIHHVHEAVKAAGERETGMTVHWVTPVCDAGEIIAQFRVSLSPDDTVEDIAEKEHQLEMEHFPKVVETIISSLLSASK